jgi:3-oxoacyl-[acyl-carrier-protein] synthase-3
LLRAKITSVGGYLPPTVLTNDDLSKIVGITDEWIVERTGIRQRRIAGETVATSDMAVEAAREVLRQRGIAAPELDAIIVGTVTPDMQFPSTACLVQDQLGARGCWGFDLAAASTGFLYGMTTAAHLVSCGAHHKILVIGADTMSRITDPADRATCILFGDGAGAFLIERAEPGEEGFIGHRSELDGSGARFLKIPGEAAG